MFRAPGIDTLVISRLVLGFLGDLGNKPLRVALVRALRASRLLGSTALRELLEDDVCRRHVQAVASDDPLFFVAHRYFVAKGLTARQRVATALHHYRYEAGAFDRRYLDAVYGGRGLVLWRKEVHGEHFDIRLQGGNDVLHEGGASVVFHHNGRRTFVISYSWVPTEPFLPGEASPTTLFIARKHAAADHEYQKVFNKAFDRTTPGHLCFAAVAGVALACGHGQLAAVAASRQVACRPETEPRFAVAYDQFWESLAGCRASPFGYRIELPMRMTPLDELDAKARKRAVARRAHIEAVRRAAFAVAREHRVGPPRAPAREKPVTREPVLEPSWALLGRL